MKNIKKYNKVVVGSLLSALILSTPAMGFADNDNKNENKGQDNKIKTELMLGSKIENNHDVKDALKNIKEENKADKKESNIIKETQKNLGFFSNWFKNHSGKILAAPSISNLVAVSTKPNKAIITWTTDNRANSYVWYGTTSPVDTSTKPVMKHNSRVLNHKIEFKKLTPNTKYYIVVGGSNNKGDGKSSEISFTTPATPVDTIAPVISNTDIKINADKNVVISWNTNELATSNIYYSTITPLDLSAVTTKSVVDATLATRHSLVIPGLTAGTEYYYVIKSVDASNNTILSKESSFKAPTILNDIPVIESVTGPTTIIAGENAKFVVNATDPENRLLSYSVNWGDISIAQRSMIMVADSIFTQTSTLNHVYNTPGTYTINFTVENSLGKKDTSTAKIIVTAVPVVDTTAPVISNIQTTVTGTNVNVSWTTNELATSNIIYSEIMPFDINAVSTKSIVNATLTKTHSINIPSLTSSTLYHFILKSADASNNVVLSSDSTFSTN